LDCGPGNGILDGIDQFVGIDVIETTEADAVLAVVGLPEPVLIPLSECLAIFDGRDVDADVLLLRSDMLQAPSTGARHQQLHAICQEPVMVRQM
jgi:hypothetical protein